MVGGSLERKPRNTRPQLQFDAETGFTGRTPEDQERLLSKRPKKEFGKSLMDDSALERLNAQPVGRDPYAMDTNLPSAPLTPEEHSALQERKRAAGWYDQTIVVPPAPAAREQVQPTETREQAEKRLSTYTLIYDRLSRYTGDARGLDPRYFTAENGLRSKFEKLQSMSEKLTPEVRKNLLDEYISENLIFARKQIVRLNQALHGDVYSGIVSKERKEQWQRGNGLQLDAIRQNYHEEIARLRENQQQIGFDRSRTQPGPGVDASVQQEYARVLKTLDSRDLQDRESSIALDLANNAHLLWLRRAVEKLQSPDINPFIPYSTVSNERRQRWSRMSRSELTAELQKNTDNLTRFYQGKDGEALESFTSVDRLNFTSDYENGFRKTYEMTLTQMQKERKPNSLALRKLHEAHRQWLENAVKELQQRLSDLQSPTVVQSAQRTKAA